jgi:hypothetical protein
MDEHIREINQDRALRGIKEIDPEQALRESVGEGDNIVDPSKAKGRIIDLLESIDLTLKEIRGELEKLNSK